MSHHHRASQHSRTSRSPASASPPLHIAAARHGFAHDGHDPDDEEVAELHEYIDRQRVSRDFAHLAGTTPAQRVAAAASATPSRLRSSLSRSTAAASAHSRFRPRSTQPQLPAFGAPGAHHPSYSSESSPVFLPAGRRKRAAPDADGGASEHRPSGSRHAQHDQHGPQGGSASVGGSSSIGSLHDRISNADAVDSTHSTHSTRSSIGQPSSRSLHSNSAAQAAHHPQTQQHASPTAAARAISPHSPTSLPLPGAAAGTGLAVTSRSSSSAAAATAGAAAATGPSGNASPLSIRSHQSFESRDSGLARPMASRVPAGEAGPANDPQPMYREEPQDEDSDFEADSMSIGSQFDAPKDDNQGLSGSPHSHASSGSRPAAPRPIRRPAAMLVYNSDSDESMSDGELDGQGGGGGGAFGFGGDPDDFDHDALMQEAMHGLKSLPHESERDTLVVQTHLAKLFEAFDTTPRPSLLDAACAELDLGLQQVLQDEDLAALRRRGFEMEYAIEYLALFLNKFQKMTAGNIEAPQFTNEDIAVRLVSMIMHQTTVLRMLKGLILAKEGQGPADELQEEDRSERVVAVEDDPNMRWGARPMILQQAGLAAAGDDPEALQQQYEEGQRDAAHNRDMSAYQGTENKPWEQAVGGNFQLVFLPFKKQNRLFTLLREVLNYCILHNLKRMHGSIVEQVWTTYHGKQFPTRTWRPWRPRVGGNGAGGGRAMEDLAMADELYGSSSRILRRVEAARAQQRGGRHTHSSHDAAAGPNSPAAQVRDVLEENCPEEPEYEDPERARRARRAAAKRASKAARRSEAAAMTAVKQMEDPFETLIYVVGDKELNFKMWSHTLKTRNLQQCARYLQACPDPQFEDISPNGHYVSWRNGTYSYETCRFYAYDDPAYPLGVVAARYLPMVYDVERLNGYDCSNWNAIPTPTWDTLFRLQYYKEPAMEQDRVVDMSHMIAGRLHSPVGLRDNWQIAPMFLVRAGALAHVIRYGILSLFDKRYVGRVANNAEEKFGLQPAVNKLIWLVVNGNRNFNVAQGDLHSAIAGEPIPVGIKRTTAKTTVLPPFLGFFEEFPKYVDTHGSMERRFPVFTFQRPVPPEYLGRLTQDHMAKELDALMHKQACAYASALELFGDCDVWGTASLPGRPGKFQIMPQAIVKATRSMKTHNHPLSYALRINDGTLFTLELEANNPHRSRLIGRYGIRMPFTAFQTAVKTIWRKNKYWGNEKTVLFSFTPDNYVSVLNDMGIQVITQPPGETWLYDGQPVKPKTMWLEGITEPRVMTADLHVVLRAVEEAVTGRHTTLPLILQHQEPLHPRDVMDDVMDDGHGQHDRQQQQQQQQQQQRRRVTGLGNLAAESGMQLEADLNDGVDPELLSFIAELPHIPLAPPRSQWWFKSDLHGLLRLSYGAESLNTLTQDQFFERAAEYEQALKAAYDSIMAAAPEIPMDAPAAAAMHTEWAMHIMDVEPQYADSQTLLFHYHCMNHGLEVILFFLEQTQTLPDRNAHGTSTNQFYLKTIATLAHCACVMLTEAFNRKMAARGHVCVDTMDGLLRLRRFQLQFQPPDALSALVVHVLQFCQRYGLRRSGRDVVRQIMSPPQGLAKIRYPTHAWERVCSIADLVMIACPKFSAAQQWNTLLQERGNVLKYFIQSMDSQFPDVTPSRQYYAFPNGLYDTEECDFYTWEDPEFPQGAVACNYFPVEMDWDALKNADFRDTDGPEVDEAGRVIKPAGAMYIEPYDEIVNYQLQGLNRGSANFRRTKEVIDYMRGRLLYPLNRYDRNKTVTFEMGRAGTGKSTQLNTLIGFVPPEYRGYMSNSCEETFGIEPLLYKHICVCTEVRHDWNVDVSQMLAMIKGEYLTVARKFKDALPVTWMAPWAWAGNLVPNFVKDSPEMQHSIVLIPYDYTVSKDQVKPEYARMLEEARPKLLVRITKAYRYYAERFGNCQNVWKPHTYIDPDTGATVTDTLMSEFLKDANRKLTMYTHPLSQALSTSDSGLYMLGGADVDTPAWREAVDRFNLRMPFKELKAMVDNIIMERNIRRAGFRWRPQDYETVFLQYGIKLLQNVSGYKYGGELLQVHQDWVEGITLESYVDEAMQPAIEALVEELQRQPPQAPQDPEEQQDQPVQANPEDGDGDVDMDMDMALAMDEDEDDDMEAPDHQHQHQQQPAIASNAAPDAASSDSELLHDSDME